MLYERLKHDRFLLVCLSLCQKPAFTIQRVECSDRRVHVWPQLLTTHDDSVAAVGAQFVRRVLAETVSSSVIVAPVPDLGLPVGGRRRRRRRDGEEIRRRVTQHCVRLAAVQARPRPATRATGCRRRRTPITTDDVVAALLRPGRQRRRSTRGTSSS